MFERPRAENDAAITGPMAQCEGVEASLRHRAESPGPVRGPFAAASATSTAAARSSGARARTPRGIRGERRGQPDGTRVVTASQDNTARVWDAATGTPVTRPLEHQATVRSAAFSPDGTRVVTASYDKTARVWDAATGKPVTHPLEHQG